MANPSAYDPFAEAGIVIASPQRYIQFDPDNPVRVELASTTLANAKNEPKL